MNTNHDFDFEDSAPPLGTTNPKVSSAQRPNDRWTAPDPALNEIVACLRQNFGYHDYNTWVDVSVQHGFVYDGPRISDVDCRGCHCAIVTTDAPFGGPKTISIVIKLPNSNGTFDDYIVPGTSVVGGFTPIGETSSELIVVVDPASGMVIHSDTDQSVVVTYSYQNLPYVCETLMARSAETRIIVAMGARRSQDISAIRSLVASLASHANIRVALPKGELTFHELHRKKGAQAVRAALAAAIPIPSEWYRPPAQEQFQPVIAWPNPVHPAGLMAGLCAHIAKHTALRFTSICAIALWIIATHFVKSIKIAPILALLSLTKRCGKTSTLHVISSLVRRPLVTSDITAAALNGACDLDSTTLVDEADEHAVKQGSPLVKIFNAGYSRAASLVWRKIGGELKSMDAFGYKLISAIGVLPDTIQDRSIVIPMLRKHRHERVEKYQSDPNDEAALLRSQLEAFAIDNAEAFAAAKPTLPDLGNDRATDNWHPLFAIASLGGDIWVANATEAAIALTPGDDEVPTIMEELVRDIAEIYGSAENGFITSSHLADALCQDREKAWATYSNGRSISYHDLALLMRRLKLKPEQKRVGNQNLKGYNLSELEDLFKRYEPMQGKGSAC